MTTPLAVALPSPRTRIRDRWAVLTGIGTVTAAAWIYLSVEAHRMSAGMTDRSMAQTMHSMLRLHTWSGTEFGLRLGMWAVMMVAMMAPTAVPMTLIYAAVARKAAREGRPVAPAAVFVVGYLAMWWLFSIGATAAQLGLDRLALLSPTMVLTSPWLGGTLLTATGIYQLTPLKRACLAHCRAPAHFISQHWRSGTGGALRMGGHLGVYCLGCCWVLMALLFVGGVMNLLWIATITVFILLEKTAPFAEIAGRVIGTAMILVGVATFTGVVALS